MKDILAKRRSNLFKAMGQGMAILFTRDHIVRSADTHFPFRGNSHFLYLTDFFESEAALVMIAGEVNSFYLFVKTNNPLTALWDGPRDSLDDIKKKTQADDVFDIKDIEEKVLELSEVQKTIYVDYDSDLKGQSLANKLISQPSNRKKNKSIQNLSNLATLVSELRVIKDKLCQQRLQTAIDYSKEAHIEAMKTIKPGMNEVEIQALVEYIFQRHGGRFAYITIAAGGKNACVLHYTKNNEILKDGDLFLLDAGMEYKGYAGDITRTYPINGLFNEAQKTIYTIVLNAQLEAITHCLAGKPYADYHEAARKVLAQGLINCGILEGDLDEVITSPRFLKYYPHGTGHYLGLDVHDTGKYYDEDKSSRTLVSGMVLTVEPGLYFPANDEELPQEYRGIGIRIEDNILITDKEPIVLSADIPKTIEDIESIMKTASSIFK